ncbi:hypothetical protein [Gymnodinialimonas sp.]
MIARLKTAWTKAPWLTTAFALAVALTLFFAISAILDAIYWADPRHIDQEIAGWMSPGYVALSWDVPREVMIEAVNRAPGGGGPHRLEDIAAEQGVPLDALITRIEAAIQAHRDRAQ